MTNLEYYKTMKSFLDVQEKDVEEFIKMLEMKIDKKDELVNLVSEIHETLTEEEVESLNTFKPNYDSLDKAI